MQNRPRQVYKTGPSPLWVLGEDWVLGEGGFPFHWSCSKDGTPGGQERSGKGVGLGGGGIGGKCAPVRTIWRERLPATVRCTC